MKIAYITKRFTADSMEIINRSNAICEEYARQGFDLTLRQLYYQHVARGYIANKDTEYKRLGSVINDARLAGLMDWDYITDRTRNLRSLAHWSGPYSIIKACADQFRYDKWLTQPRRVEVWIEKDALIGVIAGVCESLDVPYFSCRGYTSQSEVWSAGQRLRDYVTLDQQPVVFHLGDHDPSGIDMTRDISDRLAMFVGAPVEIRRLALNWAQVQQYNPPPNPAKLTDSRVNGYMARFGDESWELDALEPTAIATLIREAVYSVLDRSKWEAELEREKQTRERIGLVAKNWNSVVARLENDGGTN